MVRGRERARPQTGWLNPASSPRSWAKPSLLEPESSWLFRGNNACFFFQFVISPSVTVVCGTCSLGVRFPEPPPGQALCRAHFTGEETGPGESPAKGTSQQVQLCPSSFDSRNY